MFEMVIEQQLNLPDRTLIAGQPKFDVVPKKIKVGRDSFAVIGLSAGVRPPYVALEIEKTAKNLKGEQVSS